MAKPRPNPEFDAFTSFMDRLVSVPHSVIQERVEAHRKAAAKNPRRPGPKPKKRGRAAQAPRASASPAPRAKG